MLYSERKSHVAIAFRGLEMSFDSKLIFCKCSQRAPVSSHLSHRKNDICFYLVIMCKSGHVVSQWLQLLQNQQVLKPWSASILKACLMQVLHTSSKQMSCDHTHD